MTLYARSDDSSHPYVLDLTALAALRRGQRLLIGNKCTLSGESASSSCKQLAQAGDIGTAALPLCRGGSGAADARPINRVQQQITSLRSSCGPVQPSRMASGSGGTSMRAEEVSLE